MRTVTVNYNINTKIKIEIYIQYWQTKDTILHFIDIAVFENNFFSTKVNSIYLKVIVNYLQLQWRDKYLSYTIILYIDPIHENITVKHLNKVKKKKNTCMQSFIQDFIWGFKLIFHFVNISIAWNKAESNYLYAIYFNTI